MKNLLLIIAFFYQTETSEEISLLPTRLEIEVVDNLGNLVPGAEVMLYETKEDYLNHTNEVAKAIADSNGIVKFKELKPIPYYVDARKGDLSNDGHGAQVESLEEGKRNKVKIVVH